jgi:hypothetical protein
VGFASFGRSRLTVVDELRKQQIPPLRGHAVRDGFGRDDEASVRPDDEKPED